MTNETAWRRRKMRESIDVIAQTIVARRAQIETAGDNRAELERLNTEALKRFNSAVAVYGSLFGSGLYDAADIQRKVARGE